MTFPDGGYLIVGGDGQRYGPFRRDELAALVRDGRATAESRVWAEGMAEWVPLGQVLGDALPPAPPMATPPAPVPPPPDSSYQVPTPQQAAAAREIPGRGNLLFLGLLLLGFGVFLKNVITATGGGAMVALYFLAPAKPVAAMWAGFAVYVMVAIGDTITRGPEPIGIIIRLIIMGFLLRDAMATTAMYREASDNN